MVVVVVVGSVVVVVGATVMVGVGFLKTVFIGFLFVGWSGAVQCEQRQMFVRLLSHNLKQAYQQTL